MSETPAPHPPEEEPEMQLLEPENIIFPEEQAISDVIDEAVASAIPHSDNIHVDEAVAASIAAAEAPANELTHPDPLDGSNAPTQSQDAGQYAERPLGPVCPVGQEQTGRWTRVEQERFVEGLERYGKEWKKVAAVVETRTIVQVRTHAQKFQKKLAKIFEKPVDQVSVADFNGVTDGVGGRNKLKVAEGELKRFEKLHILFSTTHGGYGKN